MSGEPTRSIRARQGAAVAAACIFLQCAMLEAARAAPLDPEAYGITASAQAGPVARFQPVKSLPPVPFELPFDWGMDPYDDATWRFRLHTLRIVDGALAAGDFAYATEVFLDWQRWHENCWLQFLCFGRSTEPAWDDMATGIRAARLAYLLRSTGWQNQRLVELAEQLAEKLQDPEFLADQNHAIFQLHGLAALCVDKKLRNCQAAGPFLERELRALLHKEYTASGMHRENSPAYHFFVTDHLARMAPLLQPFLPEYATILERADDNDKWLVQPDLTLVQIGDSDAKLARRYRERLVMPAGDANCRGVRSYVQAPACYLARHFKDAGYVVVRSDWAAPPENASMLFVQGGMFNRTHRDADDLTFEWFERGRKILSDSGKYAVIAGDWLDYFNSTRAHNTVEVDGKDYRDEPYGSAVARVERADDGMHIAMEVHHRALDVVHRREIDYRPGERLKVTDALRSDRPKPRRFVQWHHFPRAFELTGRAGHFRASDGDLQVDIEVSSSCGAQTTYEMVKGQTAPRLQGWASLADRERHPRWALGVGCEARAATFTTAFTLGR